jgi:acyl-CoA synthetase (AMP-forming)/AMP-acid ligase II
LDLLGVRGVVSTIPAALERAAQLWPDDEALVDGSVRLTFGALAERVGVVARALVASGVDPGDRVAVWAPNVHEWAEVAFAVYAAGGVLVPVNTRFKGAEAADVVRRSQAKVLFTVTDFLDVNYVDMIVAEPAIETLREIVAISAGPDQPRATPWSTFEARAAQVPATVVATRSAAIVPGDTSDIVFTSGTTGRPKGAMLTHGASTQVYTAWSDLVGLRHGDRYLLVYPFFHTAGLKAGMLACVLVGATLVPHPVFDVPSVMQRVSEERITMLPGPPAVYQSILEADLTGYDVSSLRLAVTGAAVVPVEMVRRMRSELGLATVVTGYGLTETTGTVSMCRHDDDPEIIARTSGRPLPGVEVKVVDDAGAPVADGIPGEVLVRGYNIMMGYFNDPEATAETIDADGWLRTGDIAVVDAGGNLTITDRKKDMFIVGGFNAYPAEIESIMLGHPDVGRVAVVGIPDERLGEVGMAFIVPAAGRTVREDAFMAWCRERMANYKAPRYVQVVEALPLNATGKVMKFELRRRGQAQRDGNG